MCRFVIFFLTCLSLSNLNAQRQSKEKLSIGVFDSGTGGLTVLEAILSLDAFNNHTGEVGSDGIPDFINESFQYLADQANMPYGNYASVNKTNLLKENILKSAKFLLQNTYESQTKSKWNQKYKPSVKMLVIACNTATAYAIEDIKVEVAKSGTTPVVGVIDAGAKAALVYQRSKQRGTIGIFATVGTVASDGYPKALRFLATKNGMERPIIISQGGIGLAESIDRDFSFFSDSGSIIRYSYKGPSLKNDTYLIDTLLMKAYAFDTTNNRLLCEFDASGKCLDVQLNAPANYVRYHLVSLLERMKRENYTLPLNTLILGCTHYPYLKDTIKAVLKELYNYTFKGKFMYRQYLVPEVELIDPGVETAKEVFTTLRKSQLSLCKSNMMVNQFFISIPNRSLENIELQEDGWFTHKYKYGRIEGAKKKYVKFVPFDCNNIEPMIYKRVKSALPKVYQSIQKYLLIAGCKYKTN